MLLGEKEYYIFFILYIFYFKLYTINIFKGLVVYIRVKIYYILARNLILLILLIFTQLVSIILYNKL